MNIIFDLIYGISLGIEWVEDEEAWIVDLLFFRFVIFTSKE